MGYSISQHTTMYLSEALKTGNFLTLCRTFLFIFNETFQFTVVLCLKSGCLKFKLV